MKKLSNALRTCGRRFVPLLLACLMLLGTLQPQRALAERGPEDYVFTDYTDGYHLTSFLNGYNVLSFGNTYLGLHCIGALLVQGDYTGGGSNSGFADGDNMPPSYIKGYLGAPNSVYNSRNNRVDPLYVGSSNTVSVWQDWYTNHYSVNGLTTGNNGTTPVYVSDSFFNFAQAYAVIKQNQQNMLENSTVVEPDENGCVTIELGSRVTISSLEGVREINLTGSLDAANNTTINILDDGDITFPTKYVNGKHPAVVEQAEDGTSIVWNFVNADSVHLPTQNWIGHVIAPDADVSQDSGNYNGCIICNNLYSSAEGHLYNYASDETSWNTVFSVSKVWDDGDNADGVRPDHINVQLLANGRPQGKHVRLDEKNDWFYVWTELPETDDRGNKIVYSVQETRVPGYTSSYDQDTQTLINTHEYETVDISGTKTWLNEWGWSRPWSITVRLYADGVEVASQVVNTSYWGGWNRYTFSDLPKYKEGKEIVYTIQEDPIPGYIGKVDGYNLINTFGVEPVTVSGTKTWDDSNNADGLRPEQVVIQLLADGKVTQEQTVSAANGWSYSFTNLPEKNDAGQKITYTVREKETPRGYTATVNGYDITNKHEPEKTSVSGSKTWDDNNNSDGKRPQSITVILLANMAEVDRKTVTAADGWKWTFTDLPKNAAGTPIRYSVKEEVPAGYTAKVSGMDIVNTYESETVDPHGSKTWNDNDNQDGKRPEVIKINLLANGVKVAEQLVMAETNWAWSFTGMPKYEDGKEIVYTVSEEAVPGYTAVVSGLDITNNYAPETVSVSGSKTWNDNGNQDGKRPASITINLLANGVEVAEKSVTEADNWAWSFTDLPKYEDGKEIVYTITEDAVPSYATVVSGYNVTNSYDPETTAVSGSKTWNDNGNQDGKRPASITINLLANGVEVAEKSVTEADNWAWSFTDLPKYEDGKEIVYTITEDAVPGYATVVSGYNVTNSYDPETTAVSGAKTWNDNGNQDGKRPASITINLLANGVEVDEQSVTEVDNWAWSFTDLPKYEDGKEIVYTITEDAVPGYASVVTGYNVTNSYDPETTAVSGAKTWNDNGNQDGKRPASITINLLANGVEVDEQSVTEADNWAWSFTDLPKYEDGKEIVYTITEDAVPGYATVVSGYNVTNSYDPETTDVSGAKTWNDNGNQDGKRPASITINLLANGVEVDEKSVTAADNWAWSFTDLPKYEDGKEIVYTITEDTVPGYATVVSGYNVTNSYDPETTAVSGSKTWNDNGNQDGKRPASITINLLADGVEVTEKSVTAADNWAWSFTDLPKYEDGKEIVYTITEDAVPGYASVVTGYNVTNSYDPETTAANGSKTWNDNGNQDGKRPASITINLLANGVEVDEKSVTAADNWAWSFTDLPKYEDGKEIVYTITEDAVPGYATVVSGYNVTNSYDPETTAVSGAKTWNDNGNQDGKRPASITINLLANGVEVDEKSVTAADNWAWSFTDLPKYEDGKEIVYTITEDAVPGYASVVTGYNVTNSYAPETVSVSGAKTWNDNGNQDGKRPASITINLLANGAEVAEKSVTEADNWAWSFTDLPKYEDGKEIVYTITEDAVPGYASVVTGYNVTNSYDPETTAVSGSKTWNDNGNQDGKRPASITIRLWGNGVEVDSRTVTAADNWSWSFTDLPKYVGGRLITYTITEDAVPGYQATVTGYNVTNSYDPETTSVSGAKTWRDDGDRDGVRPASITIRLLANGVESSRKTVTAADGWRWSFTDLPRYEDGREIVYTIDEVPVPEYTTMIVDDDVINTHETETTSVEGMKLWFDEDDAYGVRPASITIHLLANGVEVDSRVVTEEDGWMWSFTELPLNENGSPIDYTIEEDVVPDYMTMVMGYNVLNTYDRTTFSVTKVWEGEVRDEIVLTLYADGAVMDPQPEVTRYGQMYVWEDLPLFNDDGEEIVYSAREKAMEGYMTIYENTGDYAGVTDRVHDGGTIVNKGVKNVFVRKIWADYAEDQEKPPIQLVLYCNGEPTDVPMPEPDKHGWYKYYNLPAMVDGELAHYTVREVSMKGFLAVYTTEDGDELDEGVDHGVITNVLIPATGDNSPLLLWAALLVAAGVGLVLLMRRRRV